MKTVRYVTILSIIFIILLSGCNSHPKITSERIQKDLVGKTIGAFVCHKDDIRNISILEKKYNDDKAIILIDIKTERHVSPQMAGKLRLYYVWIKSTWKISMIENITFKEYHE